MTRRFARFASAAFGIFLNSLCASPQSYTISAKPGVVNYIEGTAYLNDTKLSELANRNTIMSAGDTLSTDSGKAEVLLAPGVFLRIGEQSEIRMISRAGVSSNRSGTAATASVSDQRTFSSGTHSSMARAARQARSA